MAMFGSDWLDDVDDYDKNYSMSRSEDYDAEKEYENNHHIYNRYGEEYDALKEYEDGIKHFQE